MLQWITGYGCILEWFSQGICPVVGLLVEYPDLFFKEISLLFSIVTLSIHILNSSARGFPFLHILSSIFKFFFAFLFEGGHSHSSTLAWKMPWMEQPGRLQSLGVAKSWARLSDFTFTFYFHALEEEMATHSSILAWRIPGTEEPSGLSSMASHRVRHDWSDLEEEGKESYLYSCLIIRFTNLLKNLKVICKLSIWISLLGLL